MKFAGGKMVNAWTWSNLVMLHDISLFCPGLLRLAEGDGGSCFP